MNKLVSALLSFVVVFVCVFILSDMFLMPHLPAMPEVQVGSVATSNWVGIVLGAFLGWLSAKSILRTKKKKR